MANGNRVPVTRLIVIPAVITLAVTLLRLAGELNHWGMTWFGSAAGGQGAIIGISWLPFIFGPYFALRLSGTGNSFTSTQRA